MQQLAHQFTFTAMGGPCDIDVVGVERPEKLIDLAIAEVRRIETKYSRYISSSIVQQINNNAGSNWLRCDSETLGLLDYANTLYEQSEGLFDITSGVLRKIWNFKEKKIPTEEGLSQVLPLINWQNVERKGDEVRLKNVGMEIDIGGFGKEYAVDRVAGLFLKSGVTSALINFGGDVRALGNKPDGAAWQIGIQDPRQFEQCFATLALSQGALATSGDYEKFFEIEGKRYCHIFNPKTGFPVSFWRSITVLSGVTAASGAITTIAMLMQKHGLDYLKKSEFPFLAIDKNGVLYRND